MSLSMLYSARFQKNIIERLKVMKDIIPLREKKGSNKLYQRQKAIRTSTIIAFVSSLVYFFM